jgi:Peptidase family M23
MRIRMKALPAAGLLASSMVVAGTSSIDVAVLPSVPYIEVRGSERILNFDLMLHNTGDVPLRLVAIRQAVYDARGGLEHEREINANGSPSALSGLGDLVVQPGAYKDVFQPFERYGPEVELSRVHFTLVFLTPGRPVPPVALNGDFVAQVDVRPRAFHPPVYCLPLTGEVLVHDGHDLASHHRRRDLAGPYANDPGHAFNANLYAYDFVRIDRNGGLFRGSPQRKENWLTFRAPILATTAGEVIEAVDGVPDNTFVEGSAVVPAQAGKIDPQGFGNHVLVRAADGRVSWFLHMEPGSLKVKKGQQVSPGTPLGEVGFSGDSLFPHLHYTVTTDATYPSQSVPSYFGGFDRISGDRTDPVPYGQVDTGDILLRNDHPICGSWIPSLANAKLLLYGLYT